jgi:HD superfamily phosphohydrolase
MPDPHEPVYEIRDPVHGFVKLSLAERDVINCPTYQRLRDIRQLGMGHMVYPGANHTRFEHSLGCLHASSQALDLLQERAGSDGRPTFADAFSAGEEDVRRGQKILRLAALLHDLGHPPFSHSSEELLPTEVSHGGVRTLTHEDMTARLIRESEIAPCIRTNYRKAGITPEQVIAVATKPSKARDEVDLDSPWYTFLNELLAAELGSDRVDFLLRDAHHSGQSTGRFDYQKLLNALSLVPRPLEDKVGPEFKLGLDKGGWLVAEQMVVARYLMYVSLYFHKTKRIYELHLQDFMAAWLSERGGHLPTNSTEYARLTDSQVLAEIAQAARDEGHDAHAFARPFLDRSHWRQAREIVLADNHLVAGTRERPRRVPDKKRFDRLQDYVRIELGSPVVRFDSPSRSATDMFEPDTKILVLLDGRPRYLDDLSEVVRGMSSRIWRGRVYAPKQRLEEVARVCDEFLSKHPMRTELHHEAQGEQGNGVGRRGSADPETKG